MNVIAVVLLAEIANAGDDSCRGVVVAGRGWPLARCHTVTNALQYRIDLVVKCFFFVLMSLILS